MRLTLLGWTAAVASAGLLAAGYLLGYPRLALLGVGGLAALAASAAVAARRPPVDITREIFPLRVTRGEPAVGMLTAANRSRWAGMAIEVRESFGARNLPVAMPYLARGAVRDVGYQLPTSRRGVIDVGPLRWERADLLGFLRREQAVAGVRQLHVHPATHPFTIGAARRSQRWDDATSDAAPEGTITFHTLREYVPGDDLRHIHWRSSARLDTLMVRHNIDVSLPRTTVLLVTDRAAYPDPEFFEEAVEVAASAVLAAASERLPARLWTSQNITLHAHGGHDDARMFLDFLAAAELSDGGGLSSAADRLGHADAGGVLVIAAGSLEGAGLDAARRLAVRYDEAVLALLGGGSLAGRGSGPDGARPGRQAPAGGVAADLSLSVIEAASAAEFCARWTELAQR
jgi:uncharacterized protein (DUF58 family)